MTKPRFRITGDPENEFGATEPVSVEFSPLAVDLIDGRRLIVNCDANGLTRALLFTTATGAILRAEERLYCVSPGVGEDSFPGAECRMTPEQKMDVVRELNVSAVPSHIGLRKIVGGALARMDVAERSRVLTDHFNKKEIAAAVIDGFDWDELHSFAASISAALEPEVIAAE